MVETLRPDVYVQELPGNPSVPQIPSSTGAFVIVSEKGPLNEPQLVTNLLDYGKIYGTFFQGNQGPHALRLYFAEGGSRAYVVRVAGSGSAKATFNVPDTEAVPVNSLQIDALNEGAWGNFVSVKAEKYSGFVKTAVAAGATSTVVLKSVSGLEVGDYIEFLDGSVKVQRLVYAINVSTNTVTFESSYTVIASIALDSVVSSASMHRAKSKLSANVSAGSLTQVDVVDARNYRIGQLVTFMDGSLSHEVVLTGLNGNTLLFAASTFPALSAATSVVISQEFKLKVYDKGALQEAHDFLSLSSTDVSDFVETILKGTSNASSYIEVTDLGAGDLIANYPAPASYNLAGGLDGATATDADYIGDPVLGTGMWAFDKVDNINFFAIPGITTVAVQSAMVAFAETGSQNHASTTVAILDMPLAADTVLEALEYKNVTLNKDSSYAALYYPWLKIKDPENPKLDLLVAPSGSVAGLWSRIAVSRGIHKAPANELLNNAFGLTHDTQKGEHDLLNIANINVIASIPGRGIRVMGARTLQSVEDGKHYINVRRILNFVKVSLKDGLQFAIFEPNSEALRSNVANLASGFLKGLWLQGWLSPRSEQSKAFFVKADSENNTAADIAAGRLNLAVGLNPVRPAEFVVLTISLFDGVLTFNES